MNATKKTSSIIKYTSGNEIYCRGNRCEVRGSNGSVKFAGTYAACRRWLADRACRMIG